jgi:tetratricopeptide (TPR) repeat protein
MAKAKRSKAELEQLQQTVQMFEVIAETQPNDVQSLEILKEAYVNLERDTDAVKISKKIAKAYLNSGQLSSAILEYEGILQKFPDDAESLAALGELEGKMGGITSSSQITEEVKAAEKTLAEGEQFEDPNEALAKFLQENQVLSEKDVKNVLAGIATLTTQSSSEKPAPALIDLISERGISSVEKTLSTIVEKTRLPYVPLGIYDVDPSKAAMVEKEFCLKHLVLPFDQISKTLLVATVNPFDAQAKHRIESEVEGRVQWYITAPEDMHKQLKEVFRILP